MRRRIFAAIMVLLLALALAAPVMAADETDGAYLSAGDFNSKGELDGSSFLAGQNVTSGMSVNGVLLAAGYNVSVDGRDEYVMAAGYNVALGGTSRNDAFLAGYALGISGAVKRDVYAAGNELTVSGSIGRSLLASAGSVSISGEIGGNVYLSANTITITDTAVIGGTLRYNDSAQISIAPGASIGVTDVYQGSDSTPEEAPPAESHSGGGMNWAGKLWGLLGLLALGYVLLWLTGLWEKLDGKYTGAPFGKYAAAFGIGCAVLAGLPLAAVILMISRVGLRLAFILLLLYIAAIMAAPVCLCFFLGGLVWRRLIKRAPNYWLELLTGAVIYAVLKLIPVVGTIVTIAGGCLGVGVFTLLLGKRRAPKPAQPLYPPVEPLYPPIQPQQPAIQPDQEKGE